MLALIRGAGDLATGIALRLWRSGIRVVLTDLERPTAIRRTVAFSEAIVCGETTVEDVTARLAANADEARALLAQGIVPVLADPGCACREALAPDALVDAILAKRNLGTRITDAPVVVGVGPGFTAGEDCHAVIETMRGHRLARPIREGSAIPNTGTPGLIAGHAQDRVLHSPAAGILHALAQIGDQVEQDQVIAQIEQSDGSCVPVKATFTGLLRGLIRDGFVVKEGFKIADIDPRREEYENCFTISDKARALGSAVVMELVGYAARKAVDE